MNFDNNVVSEKLQSESLNAIRFPLAVMVVIIHSQCMEEYVLPDLSHLSNVDIFMAFQILLSHVVSGIAVPTFFLISGYFFFYKVVSFNTAIYKSKLKRRVHTLLIPYLLWNLFAIIQIVMLKIGAFFVKGKPLSNIVVWSQENHGLRMFWDSNVWEFNYTNWLGASTPPFSSPILTPLWFLRDLMIVVVLTPVIYYFIKHFRHWPVLLLGICYITGIWPHIHGFSTTAMFFFSLGAYYSIHGKNMVKELQKYKELSYVLILPLMLFSWYFCGMNPETSKYFYPLYIIVGVVAIINVIVVLTRQRKMELSKRLSEITFFIYVAHIIIGLFLSHEFLNRIIPTHDTNYIAMTIIYILSPVLAVIIFCIVYAIMKRTCPKILGVLTGNRL